MATMMVLNWNDDKAIASSSDESYDSDKIDSDIEAELYSVIHHQQETDSLNSEEKNLNYNNEKNSITCLENSNISINNFNLDRFSDCDLYNSFELQNDSKSNQKYCQKIASLKRKSDTFAELLNDAQSSSSFDLQNTKYEEYKRKKSRNNISKFSNTFEISSDTNAIITHDTSDSDSDIIFIEPSDSEKLFQTNLSVQTVTLNSDSEDSMSPFLQHNSLFNGPNNQNASQSNFTEKSHEELWFVNYEDMGRFKRNSGRYHESESTYCSKCYERGHTAKFCSYTKFVRCFLCGNKHNVQRCKKRTCSRCFEKGHDFRNCRQNLQTCANCQMTGHLREECPDVWRKYHLTTSRKFIASQRLDQNTPLYCYNCGLPGHFGAVCRERRLDRFSSITWPSLIDHNLPLNYSFQENSSQEPKLSFLQRCSKERREKILLKRKRVKELKKAKRQEHKAMFGKEVRFKMLMQKKSDFTGPQMHSKRPPNFNLNNDYHPKYVAQVERSHKRWRNKKRMERLRRKRLIWQEVLLVRGESNNLN